MPLFRNANPYRRRTALIPAGGVFLIGTLIVLAVLMFLLQIFAPGLLARAAAPVWQLGNGIASGFAAGTSVFGNAPELTRERDTLAAQNLALAEDNRTLTAKNADLEALIGAAPPPEHRILAGVLARPPVSPYDTLVVDAGSGKGVVVGALAYGPGGVPLGTVASASDVSAHIALFSTGGRVTEGWVGDTRIPITLTGRGGGAFDATLPRNSGIAVNAVVYVPGPGALPVGTVVRIDSSPSSPRDTIYIAPYVNLYALTWVMVASHP
ncbi:MAG: Rod shape-determining protein MreC [Parcubacteria group bacterium]|nr:Rod shape-determining protein MreC [Parcubacteria group bacterium]